MFNFRKWVAESQEALPKLQYIKQLLADVELREANDPLITQDVGRDGKPKYVSGVDRKSNPLIPYGKWRIQDDKLPYQSGFMRDQPDLSRFTLANPENLASAIIFVLLTIRADFQQVMHDFPTVMAMLHHKGQSVNTPEDFGKEVDNMHVKLSQQASPEIFDKDQFAGGYSLKSTAFGFKNDGIADTWRNREEIFSEVRNFFDKNDPVGMYRYLVSKVNGLAPVKAGFCVQIIMGKLGCIDMHNVNLYSHYAKTYGKKKLYDDLDPKMYASKNKKSVDHYLGVLDQLAEEGAETMKLWDIWTNYVAHNYVSKSTGRPMYDRQGAFAGKSVDPNDPLQQKLKGMGTIPTRPGGGSNPDATYTVGDEEGANTGSQAHRIISQVRNKQFYYDLLKAAESGLDDYGVGKGMTSQGIPDEVRVSTVKRPNKVLAYLVSNPDMAKSIGLDKDFLDRAHEALQKWGVFPGKSYRSGGRHPVLFAPEPMGSSHIPIRAKTVAKPKIITPQDSSRSLFDF